MTSPNPTPALLPCPFCESDSVSIGEGSHTDEFGEAPIYFGECSDCGAMGPSFEVSADAYPAWNRRPAPVTVPSSQGGERKMTVVYSMGNWWVNDGTPDNGRVIAMCTKEKVAEEIAAALRRPAPAIVPGEVRDADLAKLDHAMTWWKGVGDPETSAAWFTRLRPALAALNGRTGEA